MEEFFSAQLLLSEGEFQKEVAQHTAALAIDLTTGKIVYATSESERLFRCTIKNGLNGTEFEKLIPEEFRARHKLHVAGYARNPHPRAMGGASMQLQAQALTGERFPVAVMLLPVKKADRIYVILTIQPLPDREIT